MALQFGALRDALMSPGDEAKANKAAEEAAGDDRDLMRLNTMTQAIVAMLIGSQAAIWIKMGEISGQLAVLSARVH